MFDLTGGRRRSRRGAQTGAHGQAVVEFGLVALMFALLLMGIVDFAILLNGWLGVSSTSRDMARQLAVGICPSTATSCLAGTPLVAAPSSLVIQGLDRAASTPISVSIKICPPASVGTCTAYTG